MRCGYKLPQDLDLSEDPADFFLSRLVFEDDLHCADVASFSLHAFTDLAERSVTERRP